MVFLRWSLTNPSVSSGWRYLPKNTQEVSIPSASIYFVLCRVWHADAVRAEHPFTPAPHPDVNGAAYLWGSESEWLWPWASVRVELTCWQHSGVQSPCAPFFSIGNKAPKMGFGDKFRSATVLQEPRLNICWDGEWNTKPLLLEVLRKRCLMWPLCFTSF